MGFSLSDLDPTYKYSIWRGGDIARDIDRTQAMANEGASQIASGEGPMNKGPWSGQQPYLLDLFKQSQALYNDPNAPRLYPGFSQDTLSSQGMIRSLAGDQSFLRGASGNLSSLMGGGNNPGMDATYGAMGRAGNNPAMGLNMQTAMGGFLNNNPYLDATFNQAAGQVTDQYKNAIAPSIQGKFGLAGGFNRPGEQAALGRSQQNLGNTLNNLATNIYGGNYANERGLMQNAIGNIGNLYNTDTGTLMQGGANLGNMYNQGQQTQLGAIGMAPSINAAQYYGAGQLAGVGQQQDTLRQQQAMEPWQRLQMYGQNVTGNFTYPMQMPQQQPRGNTIGGLLGAGLGWAVGGPAGGGIGYQIGSNV